MVIAIGLPIFGIIDAARRPQASWTATGQKQIAWILVQVFLGALGTLVYLLAIRPKLKAVDSHVPS